MRADKALRIAVDIGGTFTDFHLHDPSTGKSAVWKTPSTPADPAIGLITGLREICQRNSYSLADIGLILHGSTIATNAVLERKLARGALITTSGFRDVLEIGRHIRRDVYSLVAEPRSLLIPRHRRFEVIERVRANGEIAVALDESALRTLAVQLLEQQIEACAIVFLHGYRNPVHEQRAAEILAELAPSITVATSFASSPEIREFERTSTTVLNALLKPVISGYLERLEESLSAVGVNAPLYLVQSNGGVVSPQDAAQLPAKLLLSGPAGGAMAMAELARRHRIENLVGFDMGGTSSDVSVVVNGEIGQTAESSIDGLPVRLPMIEIRTIGAGGGSIAKLESGALRVGPQSAGSEPGPVCYGRGGKLPTVTDANVILGRLSGDSIVALGMQLDVTAASAAMANEVASELQMSSERAADGVIDIACAHMAGAIRLSLFEKGADPVEFALAPFGGAAGLHACAVAEQLGIEKIIFPAHASTLSAHGILQADLRHDLSHSQLLLATEGNLARLDDIVAQLREQGRALLVRDKIEPSQQKIEFSCDMRYRGQAFELSVPWSAIGTGVLPSDTSIAKLIADFHQLHASRFAHSAPQDAVEIVTLRAVAVGLLAKAVVSSDEVIISSVQKPQSKTVYAHGAQISVDCWRRNQVHTDRAPLPGPVMIEEEYTVLYISEGWCVTALAGGDLQALRVQP